METAIQEYEKYKDQVYKQSLVMKDAEKLLRQAEISLFHEITSTIFNQKLEIGSIVSLGTIYYYKVKYIGIEKLSWNRFEYSPVIKLLRVKKDTFEVIGQDVLDLAKYYDIRRIKEVFRFGEVSYFIENGGLWEQR